MTHHAPCFGIQCWTCWLFIIIKFAAQNRRMSCWVKCDDRQFPRIWFWRQPIDNISSKGHKIHVHKLLTDGIARNDNIFLIYFACCDIKCRRAGTMTQSSTSRNELKIASKWYYLKRGHVHMTSSKISGFWTPSLPLSVPNSRNLPSFCQNLADPLPPPQCRRHLYIAPKSGFLFQHLSPWRHEWNRSTLYQIS